MQSASIVFDKTKFMIISFFYDTERSSDDKYIRELKFDMSYHHYQGWSIGIRYPYSNTFEYRICVYWY